MRVGSPGLFIHAGQETQPGMPAAGNQMRRHSQLSGTESVTVKRELQEKATGPIVCNISGPFLDI